MCWENAFGLLLTKGDNSLRFLGGICLFLVSYWCWWSARCLGGEGAVTLPSECWVMKSHRLGHGEGLCWDGKIWVQVRSWSVFHTERCLRESRHSRDWGMEMLPFHSWEWGRVGDTPPEPGSKDWLCKGTKSLLKCVLLHHIEFSLVCGAQWSSRALCEPGLFLRVSVCV